MQQCRACHLWRARGSNRLAKGYGGRTGLPRFNHRSMPPGRSTKSTGCLGVNPCSLRIKRSLDILIYLTLIKMLSLEIIAPLLQMPDWRGLRSFEISTAQILSTLCRERCRDLEYHCEFCDSANYDQCHQCFVKGKHCWDKAHLLVNVNFIAFANKESGKGIAYYFSPNEKGEREETII